MGGVDPDDLFDAIAGDWQKKRPVWVMLMINSLTEDDVRDRGQAVLDLHMAREARRMGKTVGAVEQVEEQCLPLNRLRHSQVINRLNKSNDCMFPIINRLIHKRKYLQHFAMKHKMSVNCLGDICSQSNVITTRISALLKNVA